MAKKLTNDPKDKLTTVWSCVEAEDTTDDTIDYRYLWCMCLCVACIEAVITCHSLKYWCKSRCSFKLLSICPWGNDRKRMTSRECDRDSKIECVWMKDELNERVSEKLNNFIKNRRERERAMHALLRHGIRSISAYFIQIRRSITEKQKAMWFLLSNERDGKQYYFLSIFSSKKNAKTDNMFVW